MKALPNTNVLSENVFSNFGQYDHLFPRVVVLRVSRCVEIQHNGTNFEQKRKSLIVSVRIRETFRKCRFLSFPPSCLPKEYFSSRHFT